jgi:hypothetical protein
MEGSGSPEPEVGGLVNKNEVGGSGGWIEGTAGQSDKLDTFLDDEDMAYGQATSRMRRRKRGTNR